MTKTEIRKALLTVEKLRNEGFSVVIWYPEELGTVSTEGIEQACIEAGWEYINDNQLN